MPKRASTVFSSSERITWPKYAPSVSAITTAPIQAEIRTRVCRAVRTRCSCRRPAIAAESSATSTPMHETASASSG